MYIRRPGHLPLEKSYPSKEKMATNMINDNHAIAVIVGGANVNDPTSITQLSPLKTPASK